MRPTVPHPTPYRDRISKADRLIEEHLDNERRPLSGLSASDTKALASLLGRLAGGIENRE